MPIVRLHRRQRSFKQADITRAANATARAGASGPVSAGSGSRLIRFS